MRKQELIKKAKEAYYTGEPIMSDGLYDNLVGEEDIVGHEVVEGRITLPIQMYSLRKEYVTTLPNFTEHTKVLTPKLDGASAQVFYSEGHLVGGATRGDGVSGKPISLDTLSLINNIPEYLEGAGDNTYVLGEVVALNPDVENARNVCAGILNTKNKNKEELVALIKEYRIYFIPYDLHDDNLRYTTLTDTLAMYPGITVLDKGRLSKCDKDGVVERINNFKDFEAEGFTSHHPRGAVAYKEKDKTYTTTLKDITWGLGKSGAITPVAILEPIKIEGATISKATLHNYAGLEALIEMGLGYGSEVSIIRAGKIIPQVVGILSSGKDAHKMLVTTCPSCGVEGDRVGPKLVCNNNDCVVTAQKQVRAYCKSLRLLGFGEKTLEKLGVVSINDLYALEEKEVASIVGDKTSKKLLDELHNKAYNISILKFLPAMSIPLVGNTVASKLGGVSWESLQEMSVQDLRSLGLGEKAALSLLEHLPKILAKNLPVCITSEKEPTTIVGNLLNIKVCITGKLNNFRNRKEATLHLTEKGFTVVSSVTSTTNYLVCEDGKTTSSSYKKAEANGVQVVTIKYLEDKYL